MTFIVLHPRYKLEYFIQNEWPQEWINVAKELAQEYWVTYYKPSNTAETMAEQMVRFYVVYIHTLLLI